MLEIIVFRSYFVTFSFSVMLLIFKFFFSFLSSFFLPLFFSWDQWKSHRVVVKSIAYESTSSNPGFSTLWTCDLGQVASLLGVSGDTRESLCFLLGKGLQLRLCSNFADGRLLWGEDLRESSPPPATRLTPLTSQAVSQSCGPGDVLTWGDSWKGWHEPGLLSGQ